MRTSFHLTRAAAPRGVVRRRFLGSLTAAASSIPIGRWAAGVAPALAAEADVRPDWDVPGGHFYTQMAPEDAPADGGYVVSDADDVALWRDYVELGGPAQFGYPISNRFEYQGIVYQALQSAVLRWDAAAGRSGLDEVFVSFLDAKLDPWLEARGLPRTAPQLVDNRALDAHARLSWLTHETLQNAYLADGEEAARRRYGLPMSEVQRFGPYLAQRFDKAILQLWLDSLPGHPSPGTVALAQAGSLLAEAGMVPEEALAAEAAPAPRPAPEAEPPPRPAVAAPAAAIASGKYVVVSVGRQWWWAYENGRLLSSGPVTTGRPELFTPIGRYSVLSKHSPYTFVSPWPPGSPFWYETATSSYALRITGNGIFLHDAPWRPFNGPGTNVPHTDPDGVWRTGSHGCINMPFAAAQWLYNWAPTGTPVDVVA